MRNIKLKTIVLVLLTILIITTAALYLFADKAFKLLLSDNVPGMELLPEKESGKIENSLNPAEVENYEEKEVPGEIQDNQSESSSPGSVPESPQDRVTRQDSENKKDIDVDEISKNISFADKRRILLLVAKRLSAEDVKYLLGLLKGGLTESEKREAVKLAFKRFSRDEIDEIRALYEKYRHLTK